VSKDPKRWQETIISSPLASLTKQDVHDYYANPAVRNHILKAVRGTGSGETILRQSFSPERVVLRRKDHKGSIINLNGKNTFDQWNQMRMTEVHPVFGKTTGSLLADIDPGKNVPWEKTKAIAETIAKTMASDQGMKDVTVQFSGDDGFYVKGLLKKKMDVNDARKKVKDLMQGIIQRPDVTLSKATSDQIRIDTTPLKNRGSVKAPYSLSAATGLVAAPVSMKDLGKVKREDFKIEKIKVAAEDNYIEAIKNEALRGDIERAMQTYESVEDKAHGRPHVENVIRAANQLNQTFRLPPDRVTAAAALHDIGNPIDRKRHAEIGAELAPQYLQALPPLSQAAVTQAVREHRYTSGNPRSRLAKMINDADTLSDFEAANDPDYFFRRLVEYRKAKGMAQEDVYDEARNYAIPWLEKALSGGLRTEEALEQYRPRLEEALSRTRDPEAFREYLQPMVEQEYGKTAAKKEFAPGIPMARKIDPIPSIKNKAWTLSVQQHDAHKAGKHYDVRLVDHGSQKAHSFAVPRGRLPTKRDRMLLAVQQPTHTADYALNFEGKIPAGTYGAGDVKIKLQEPVNVVKANADRIHFERPNGRGYVLFRTQGNNWGFKQKKT
jgi:hypothetical protein